MGIQATSPKFAKFNKVLFFCCWYLFLPSVHDVHRSAPDQINQLIGEDEQQTNLVRYQLKLVISFSCAKIAMGFAILLAFLNGAQDIRAMHSSGVIVAYYFFIWSTIISPIVLLMYSVFLFGHYKRINRNQKIYLICLITISCVLVYVTSYFSIVLQNKESTAGISLIVIPVIAIVCFVGYTATRNVSNNDSTTNHERCKSEQKKAFKFSTTISTMAITVQTSMIYASFKSPPLQAVQSFQFGLSLFFLISMVGIFVMMVTSIPLTVHYTLWRGSLLSIVSYSSTVILGLLGLSVAALAMQFLGSLIIGVFLLVLVPIFVYFAQEHFGTGLRDPASAQALYHDPRYAGVIRNGISTLVSLNGGLLVAICVVSVGISSQQYYMSLGLRVYAFFQLLAIESGLICIGLMFEPQHSEMWTSIIEIFYSVSLLLQIVMIMAGVMVFIVLS